MAEVPLAARAKMQSPSGPTDRGRTPARPAPPAAAGAAPAAASRASVLWLQGAAGNTATARLVDQPAVRGPSVQRDPVSPAPAAGVTRPSPGLPPSAGGGAAHRIGFVREEGLRLRSGSSQSADAVAELRFGTRVHVLEEEALHPGWQKVTTPASTVGYLSAPRVHLPPADLIARDPAMTLVRVQPGQTFWGLVKDQYHIQGNESTADQNVNHFINAIRAVNKTDAFLVRTDWLDDLGNWAVSGRDASDTLLKAGYDLWIPSFGVAAAMDVGSGTVTGEAARIVKKIQQKIDDFGAACAAATKYVPDAVARHAGDTALGLLSGLVDFAKDAAAILAVSTAAGAILGAVFGAGAGAVPGAEIGFEIGLLILEYYGLAMLVETILSMAGSLLSALGSFISLTWNANGDAKQLDTAGRTLADALGILVSALLLALAAYLTKKGAESLGRTKLGAKLGQTEMAKWLAERQKRTTTAEALDRATNKSGAAGKAAASEGLLSAGAKHGLDATPETVRQGTVRMEQHPDYGTQVAYLQENGFTVKATAGDPCVVVRQVVGPDGAVLRVEREVQVRPGMRYLDLEHELGHVRQALDRTRFPEGPKPTDIVTESGRPAPSQSGVLTTKENAVMEYHNRLQELVELDRRGLPPDVLREHLDGIDGTVGTKGWRQRYKGATAGGEKSSMGQFARDRFPDIAPLEVRVEAIRARLKAGGTGGAGQPAK